MLNQILKTYGRRRPHELAKALMELSPAELVGGIVKLITAGEIRLLTRAKKRRAANLCARFYRYHEENPHVADWFLSAAQALQKEQHRTRYAIGALTERIRWDIRAGVIKTDGFRISNDIRACYARVILMRDPSLCGLFMLKQSAADELVMEGQSWRIFAQEHHAELWPEDATEKRKPNESATLQSEFKLKSGT